MSLYRVPLLSDLVRGAMPGDCGWQDLAAEIGDQIPDYRVTLFAHDARSAADRFVLTRAFSADKVTDYNDIFPTINPWVKGGGPPPCRNGCRGRDDFLRGRVF